MTYTNIPTVISQQTTNYNSGNIPYTAISLIPGIPHSAQLEVERIFSQDRDGSSVSLLDFLADPVVTTAQKKAVFIIPISRCTLNSATSNITAIDLPVSGSGIFNYTVTTPTTTHTIKVPVLSNSNATVTVRRKTISNQPLVNWVSGSRLTSKQLNLSTTQSLYLIQEALEKIGTSVTFETTLITVASLASNSINSAALIDLAVTTAKIADLAVTTAKIADSAVTTAKILDANVTTAKILDANVTTAKIADSAVTTAKIADNAVTTGKIADGTILNADINASAGIADTKLATIFTAGKVSNSATTAVTTANANTIMLRGANGEVTTNALTASSISTAGNLLFNNGFGSAAFGYGCRAFVNFTSTSTPTVFTSGNVSGITDNGVGDFTINFNFVMPDTLYCVATSGARITGELLIVGVDFTNPTKTTSAVRVCTKAPGFNRADSYENSIAIFR